MVGALVGHKVLGLKQVGRHILEAAVEEPGTDGLLVDAGSAPKLLAAILRALARETSPDEMASQWEQSGLQFSAFIAEVSVCSRWVPQTAACCRSMCFCVSFSLLT